MAVYATGAGVASVVLSADPSGFECNKKKRFVPGAVYSQWSSYTDKGGEAGRALCRAHFKNGASAPNGWWYQYYSNGHFNCAKFNAPVNSDSATWEDTHGRPEEVCVPTAPVATPAPKKPVTPAPWHFLNYLRHRRGGHGWFGR